MVGLYVAYRPCNATNYFPAQRRTSTSGRADKNRPTSINDALDEQAPVRTENKTRKDCLTDTREVRVYGYVESWESFFAQFHNNDSEARVRLEDLHFEWKMGRKLFNVG